MSVARLGVEMQCGCGFLILKSYKDGTTKLRAKIILFNSLGETIAICKECGKEHPIPVRLQKAFPTSSKVRHYVLERG